MSLPKRPFARPGRVPLVALFCLALLGQAALAQVTVGSPALVVTSPAAVEGSGLVADFPVTAGPDGGMQIVLPPQLVPLLGTAAPALRWSRADTGASVAAGVPVALAPGATVAFRMEADLPDTARYAARLIVRRAGIVGGQDQMLGPYVFARKPMPLPADFLPRTPSQEVSVWPWLPATAQGADARIAMSIQGRNATDHPLTLDGIALGALTREGSTAGVTTFSYPTGSVKASNGCTNEVAPGAFCTVDLDLPGLLAPGRYRIDMALRGAEGGVSVSTATLTVRAPWWFAAFVVGLGAMVGAAVAHWREVDRPRALVELPLVQIADKFRDLSHEAASRDVAAVSRDKAAEIGTALSQGRLGMASPALDPAVLSVALRALRSADRSIADAVSADLETPQIHAAMTALVASLGASPWDAAATEAAARKLDLALDAARNAPLGRKVVLETAAPPAQVTYQPGQFLPGTGANAAAYLQRIARMDMGTALFTATLIGLGGLAVFWVGNPVWGSAMDLVLAFTAGVATRLTLPSPVARP